MSKQDGILLAAVQLRRFSSRDLLAACERQPNPPESATVRKWLTRSVAQKLIAVTGTVKNGERGRPSDLYEIQEAGRVAARANVALFRALATAQFSQGHDYGFKARPDFADLNLRAEELLRETLGEFRHVVDTDLPTSGSERIALFDRLRVAFSPTTASNRCVKLDRMTVLRRDVEDEVSRIGDVIDSWESIEHPVPAPLIQRYRAIKNVCRDPRTFLLVATLQDIGQQFLQNNQRSNTQRHAPVIAAMARVIGHDANEEAQRALRNAERPHAGSNDAALVVMRVQPSHRLVYAIDYEWGLPSESSAAVGQTDLLSASKPPAWTACLSLLSAHADLGRGTTAIGRPGLPGLNVTRAAISYAAKRIGWQHVAASIIRLQEEVRISQTHTGQNQNHLQIATDLSFALRDIMSSELKDVRPTKLETLTLLGAMLQLLHQPAMRPLEALLRNACSRRLDRGFSAGDKTEFDHLLQPDLIAALDHGVDLRNTHPDWYEDLVAMAPPVREVADPAVKTGGQREARTALRTSATIPKVPEDVADVLQFFLQPPQADVPA